MEEIEVGEYVRTKLGDIGKIIEITPNYLRKDDGFKIWLNKYDPITKHSKNIIDLIEVGDFVNGEYVLEIDNNTEQYGDKTIITELNKRYFNSQIINILTHQQYEANCYRLEE